uniref:DUF2490 domain-containing protein n=1 Tax=Aquiflexum sp. TaxID=1872584 RepID=UPI0035936000
MKRASYLLFFIIFCDFSLLQAQVNRERENNQIGWFALFMNYKLDEKWSLHGEFQWRRADWIAESQQNLYRVGVNYKLHPQVTFRAGYAFADTYKYGKVPISSNAIRFPEHRSYQMVTLSNPVGILALSHRFMLEQRWVGRSLDPLATKADELVFYNRLRYMFRTDIPLKGPSLDSKEPYLAFYDEIMIGFGKNINQNVFDQNRLGLLAGYKFSDTARIEGGY